MPKTSFFYLIYYLVGNGATSNVFKATLKIKNKESTVAIKHIKKVFDHTVFAQRAVREMKILRYLSGHDNVSDL